MAARPITLNADMIARQAFGYIQGAIEYYRDKTSRTAGGGVAVFDRFGKQVRFFDTGRYLPTQVCFGPDHSIWALGWQGPSGQDNDYFVLRNYLQDGQELGAFLLRSSFEPEPDPVGPMIGRWQLRIMGGRVGALFYESMIVKQGQNSRLARQWIETDLTGRALGRWDISGDRSPEAFTESGALYKHEGDAVLVFDRTAKAWRQVATVPNGILLGADGDSLVFEMRGTSTLRWMLASQ